MSNLMKTTKPKIYNIYIILFILFILTMYLFEIIIPFVVAFMIAYIVNPLKKRLEKYINKTLASFLSILFFILCILAIFILVSPIILKQLQNLVLMTPLYLEKIENLINKLDDTYLLKENIENGYYFNFIKPFFTNLISAGNNIINHSILFFNGFFNIILVFVISFYMLLEIHILKSFIFKIAKKGDFQHFAIIIEQIDSILSKFIRGQGLICLILSIFYSITLYLVDINFGILLGFFAGIISFIPYVGAILGGGFTLILGVTQFGFNSELIFLLLIFMSGQLLESYYLTPKFVGDAIKLNPIWIIFALLSGAHLAGLIGVLIALPVAAIIGVLVRYYYNLLFENN